MPKKSGVVYAGGFGCLEELNICIKAIAWSKDKDAQRIPLYWQIDFIWFSWVG